MTNITVKIKNYLINNKTAAITITAVVILMIGFLINDKYGGNELQKAARVGEKTTHQLLVQIENLKGCTSGCLERGDIVMITDANKQWSAAEQEGFLIIKMDITEAQASVLVQALEKDSPTAKSKDGLEPVKVQIKRRKYMVDLARLGIAPTDEKGRVMDKIYSWDIVKEKSIR